VSDRKVLIACWSNLAGDPRIQRQISWLSAAGWQVDTLGEGPHPHPSVSEHFAMTEAPRWTRNKLGLVLLLTVFPYRKRFDALVGSRFPYEVTRRAESGHYDVIVTNDIEFLPWSVRTGSTPGGRRTHHHLDLHEFHIDHLLPGTSAKALVTPYYLWTRRLISSPVFRSRTTVAAGIADLYATKFGIPKPAVVRNCPDFIALDPQPVRTDRVGLLYHGSAAWERGLGPLMDSLSELDDRFHLTLMLTGSPEVRAELAARVSTQPLKASIVPPVPMDEISRRINDFDLEVMLYPPTDENLLLALPNKLFEAVQGRLGLVIGHSPSMQGVVEEFSNGLIVDGWDGTALARALNATTSAEIERMKAGSAAAASVLNSAHEGRAFLAAFDGVAA
jgi:glycosyltransferase involved in cell wall biosynthesis